SRYGDLPPCLQKALSRLVNGRVYMTRRLGDSLALGCDFTAVVVAASDAHVVRARQFTAVRTLLAGGRLERMMRPAHVVTRLGYFLLRDRHGRIFRDVSASGLANPPWGCPKARLN